MLYAEWYADDGNAECYSKYDMRKGYFYSSKHYPDDVHQDGQASCILWSGGHVMTEWPKCQTRHLEQLHSEWYADDGDAEQDAYQCIIQADEDAS